METKIRTDLLRELAQHLLKGKLGHEKFDFATFNEGFNGCGTNGCAIGECPVLWPEIWCFSYDMAYPVFITTNENQYVGKTASVWEDVKSFFGINMLMAAHLFSPSSKEDYTGDWDNISQSTMVYGGQLLDDRATKSEVAQNILLFCDRADAGQFTT